MKRVKLYPPDENAVDVEALNRLLDEAGCITVEDIDENQDVDALIVVMVPGGTDSQDLEETCIQASSAGVAIIGIWAPGAEIARAHPAIEKYSTDQIVWDVQRLRSALSPEQTPQYDTPLGNPREAPFTERHNC